ncbi:gp53-like domain-containing protein, partial [Xenorhabdus sp. KJ12.1]|uniref:gp53-like domain-containing protein n=1 Tax=Xenorhabdus sp. KJ12.1 TaxID=1851571 RepID=UPI00403FD53A
NLGLTETRNLAQNAYPKTGGKIEGKVDVASDIEATGWIGGKELWERKSDGGWVRAYTPQNKPSAAEIQVEPRFNNTIDLTGLSSDRYYPVWWRFPHNDSGANPWLTIHRNYAKNRGDKNPFGKDVTHLAGLLLQMEGGDTRWGGDAQYLNIKRIRQTYRNTVKNIRYAMMSIARPIDDKYPLYEGVKSGDIVQSPVFSGCYLRGGLTYHVTSNFSDIHYSREDGEVEAHQSIQPYNNFEIKWMVKSYAIDDPQLGSEYDDTVLPYAHDYAETINLAKNAYPKTGGKIEGKVDVTSDIEATGWIGGKELWERKPNGEWVRAYTPQNKPSAADIGALPITGGQVAGNVDATGWVGGKELWERKSDGGWVRAYTPQNKPSAAEIQVEPRFNNTIDLTGLSSDRYYPVWWRFPHNDSGANPWLTIHRNYAKNRGDKNPFGKDVTHLAGLLLQMEGGDTRWGGDAQYLNIKRIRQTYRNTVKNIRYAMMSIARPIDDKYPLYEGVKSGDIVQSPVFSGCYLRGGLTYHVTSNFSDIHYSREDGEVEAHQSIQPYNNFEIKWMVKSYAIDDPQLGSEYDDTVLPYAHDYAETINLAKNAYPKTGGKIEGKVDVTSDIEATGWIGGKELWERRTDGSWVRAATLDDITANKSTAQKEPNGWWKCGDTGMIIQWGVVHGRSGTTNVSLPIPFPTTGAMAVGTVYKAIHYGDDDVSSSVMLVDNSTLRVTIDYNLPTAWIAIGY